MPSIDRATYRRAKIGPSEKPLNFSRGFSMTFDASNLFRRPRGTAEKKRGEDGMRASWRNETPLTLDTVCAKTDLMAALMKGHY